MKAAFDCARFGRWLDDGRPAPLALAAADHAAACERCRAALAAERAIETLLSAPPAAPAGFTDHVMRAVDLASAARAHAAPPAWNDALPWWARAAMQPPVLGASALAAVLMWNPPAVVNGARVAFSWLAVTANGAAGTALGPAGDVVASSLPAQLAFLVPAAVLLTLTAGPIARWTERVTSRPLHH